MTEREVGGEASSTVLLGPASLDRYVDGDGHVVAVLPGGGALNMAYHWAQAGFPATFLSRVGDDHPGLFRDFMVHHGIPFLPGSLVARGPSASIDIEIRPDRQPWMDHFVEGVWATLALTAEEEAALAGARHLHAVLVDVVAAEVHRLGERGSLDHLDVAVDFLSFRHYDLDRFAATLRHVDLAFVGWPGDPDDAVVQGIARHVLHAGRRAVVTFGAHGVLAVDGPSARRWFVPVEAVEVRGTTVGCGDAFIAAFLAAWWSAPPGGDPPWEDALENARRAGAAATEWLRPLPDEAYR